MIRYVCDSLVEEYIVLEAMIILNIWMFSDYPGDREGHFKL
jgi:hypothetical protein